MYIMYTSAILNWNFGNIISMFDIEIDTCRLSSNTKS